MSDGCEWFVITSIVGLTRRAVGGREGQTEPEGLRQLNVAPSMMLLYSRVYILCLKPCCIQSIGLNTSACIY